MSLYLNGQVVERIFGFNHSQIKTFLVENPKLLISGIFKFLTLFFFLNVNYNFFYKTNVKFWCNFFRLKLYLIYYHVYINKLLLIKTFDVLRFEQQNCMCLIFTQMFNRLLSLLTTVIIK